MLDTLISGVCIVFWWTETFAFLRFYAVLIGSYVTDVTGQPISSFSGVNQSS